MPSIYYLINRLSLDYPNINFIIDKNFSWSRVDRSVHYVDESEMWPMLIHEIAHHELEHSNYKNALHLLNMERDAWIKAIEIAKKYDLKIDNDVIESSLDSYRDWVHNRSKCPECNAIGVEISKNYYQCIQCDNYWKVNDARQCGLKRYKITK